MNFNIKKSFGSGRDKLFAVSQIRRLGFARANKIFSWRKILTDLIILVSLILFMNTFGPQIRNYFYYVSSPVSKIFISAGSAAHNFFEPLFNSGNLKTENNDLIIENRNLLFRLASLEGALRYNNLTEAARENSKENNFNLIPLKVISLNLSRDFIIINKGLSDGMALNMPIISSEKIVLGRISKVYKNFSEVFLLSSKESVTDVKIQNDEPSESPVYGAVKGSGNMSVYLDLVNSDSLIKGGDIIVTSGLEGIFPENLLVGKIKSVVKNDLKPFQTAEVEPFFNAKNIDDIFVITNYKK